jgi:hypothetical protein
LPKPLFSLWRGLPTFGILAGLVIGCSPTPTGEQPRAEYDWTRGRLKALTYDANRNGKNDAVSHMDGTRVIRIDLDLDENGKVERWDFYRPDQKLEKVGLSRLNDGVMDAQAFYDREGLLARIEVSMRRDGRFDRLEFYDRGVLTRADEDTNRDGRPDKWETYRREPNAGPNEPAYAITSTAFDESGSGRPERRLVFGPRGTIARVEVDPDGDGAFAPLSGGASTR